MKLNMISLFSGIGAFEVAAKRVFNEINIKAAAEIDKYARLSYLANHKIEEENFHKDIYSFDATLYKGEIDIVVGGSPCFVDGTLIYTKNGFKPIEKIVVGDEVLTHTNTFNKVLKVGSNENKETVILSAMGIVNTECTLDHPYYVREKKKKWVKNKYEYYVEDPNWKEISKAKIGDFIGIPINLLSENPLNISKDEAYVLGRYLADGHTRKDFKKSGRRNWQLMLSIGNNKVGDFTKINLNKSILKHTESVFRVVFSNKRLVELAEKYLGIGALNKKLSNEFLNLPIDILKKVIIGYMEGDGCKINNKLQATTISKELAITMSMAILKCFRELPSIHFTKRESTCIINGRVVNQKDTFLIRTFLKRKRKPSFFIENNIAWTPIKKIKLTDKLQTVYNIEVEEDNSYTANNAIVHNCQDFSIAGLKAGVLGQKGQLIWEYYRIIQEVMPKYFIYENVKGMKSDRKGETLKDFLEVFKESGYYCHWQVLNTKHYGIPQNRESIFIVGFLDKEIFDRFTFPEKMNLEKRVIDLLEDNIPQKYYLSKKFIFGMEERNKMHKKKGNGFNFNPKMHEEITAINCLTTKYGSRASDTYLKEAIYDINPCLITKNNLQEFYEQETIEIIEDNFIIDYRTRKLTPKECLRFQDFPDSFEENCRKIGISDTQLYKQAGNSISANVLEMIFIQLKEAINTK